MSEINTTNLYVLDQGFVKYIDHVGSDKLIVDAARVSYADGTKQVSTDEQLIDYLMRHYHMSPFEMVSIVFHTKVPIFVMRQWDRHRTGKKNEISGRYSVMKEEFHLPETLRAQGDKKNKQMSGEPLPETMQNGLKEDMADLYEVAYRRYEKLLERGVSREQARMVLPQSLYTEMYWKCDLRNLFGFLGQRLDSHAQPEIREFANALAYITRQIVPVAFAAFEEHQLYAERFSNTELYMMKEMIRATPEAAQYFKNMAAELGLRKTRLDEFYKKLDIEPVRE